MSYTAPHLRNKKATKLPTIDEFPALGTAKPKTTTWTKSFSSLASEWNKQTIEQEEERKYHEEMQKELERREALNSNFGFVRHNYYDEGPIYRDYDEEKPKDVTTDGWTLIDRVKYRPELSIEEKNEKEIAKEEAERQAKEEMSVWKSEEWDVRDRRVIS
jgi:hypothetical protein